MQNGWTGATQLACEVLFKGKIMFSSQRAAGWPDLYMLQMITERINKIMIIKTSLVITGLILKRIWQRLKKWHCVIWMCTVLKKPCTECSRWSFKEEHSQSSVPAMLAESVYVLRWCCLPSGVCFSANKSFAFISVSSLLCSTSWMMITE